LPAIFVGVDVFHAPVAYDPKTKQKGRKSSCAAVIVQLLRSDTDATKTKIELYTETYRKYGGEEYNLKDAISTTVGNALKAFKVTPASCIVWRDGIGDSEFDLAAKDEIAGLRLGLNKATAVGAKKTKGSETSLAYIVCQKRIATKFLSHNVPGHEDGKFGVPSGTLVQALQNITHQTFYINGRCPPNSTPKPVRFTVITRDDGLKGISLADVTWDQCHEYPNWAGPIKVPAVCQMAHKLAELAGVFVDCGETINHQAFINKVHFL
jgi:aubergine